MAFIPLSQPPPHAVGEGALFGKLQLLNWLRLGVGTVLLGVTAWLKLGSPDGLMVSAQSRLPYVLIISLYLGSLVAAFLLRTGRYLRALAWFQVAGDLLSASGFVYLTGGVESFSTLLFAVAIVLGGVSLGRRGALVAALASAGLYICLVLLMEWGTLLVSGVGRQDPLSIGRILPSLLANLVVFALTLAVSRIAAGDVEGKERQIRQQSDELHELHADLDAIMRSISTGILTVNGSQRITFLNPAGEFITGVHLSEVLGARLSDAFPAFAEALRRSLPGRGELQLTLKDGTVRVLGYQQTPLQEKSSGSLSGLLLWFQDLTERRALEEAVKRSERLAAVGKLSAGLAHEIRNPLASMTGSIQLLAATPALSDKDRRLMQIVLRESERLEALVKDFLAFARPAPLLPTKVVLSAFVDEVLALFQPAAQAKGIEVSADLSSQAIVRADEAQLKQVLWNLLGNAAEATPRGGSIQVRVSKGAFDARLEIEDTGEGIAPDDLGRIFDPFFTTKERGSGLGLAIVHRIVEAHGGRIDVQSTPGQGSLFTVMLPTA